VHGRERGRAKRERRNTRKSTKHTKKLEIRATEQRPERKKEKIRK